MKIDELLVRIEDHERLLLLEKRHLRDVRAQHLDQSTAQWVVEIRTREIVKLKILLRKLQSEASDSASSDFLAVKPRPPNPQRWAIAIH